MGAWRKARLQITQCEAHGFGFTSKSFLGNPFTLHQKGVRHPEGLRGCSCYTRIVLTKVMVWRGGGQLLRVVAKYCIVESRYVYEQMFRLLRILTTQHENQQLHTRHETVSDSSEKRETGNRGEGGFLFQRIASGLRKAFCL